MFITLDSTNLCYDRIHPNGNFHLHERVIKSLPEQPKVHVINVFELSKMTGQDALKSRVQYVKDVLEGKQPSTATATDATENDTTTAAAENTTA